jgi:hypothetical protein
MKENYCIKEAQGALTPGVKGHGVKITGHED